MITPETAPKFVAQAKDWRKRMDAILQEMKDQMREERRHRPEVTREVSAEQTEAIEEAKRNLALSRTELENSIMRLGMRLKEINKAVPGSNPNPYPGSYDPTNPKVEPTADGLRM